MAKYISFGNWNKKYFAIILEVISLILYHLLTGFDFGDAISVRIVQIGKFRGHYIIHYFFLYIIVFIISLIFYLIDKYKNKNNEDDPKNRLNYTSIMLNIFLSLQLILIFLYY